MRIYAYDRTKAFEYAREWALARNPAFYDFSNIGGDCTNFASQCIYAGTGIMNYLPVFGWFYRSTNDRTPSWTGVEYLYKFLVNNKGLGPFAEEVRLDKLQVGDIVQLGRETGDFYHCPVVVGIENNVIYVAAHSFDTFYKPLYSFTYELVRGLHILGVRKEF